MLHVEVGAEVKVEVFREGVYRYEVAGGQRWHGGTRMDFVIG